MSRRLLSPIGGDFRLHDESLRRGADVIEGVTGDQRQCLARRWFENQDIVWPYDAGAAKRDEKTLRDRS